MPITFPNLPNQPNLPNANTARPGISHRPIHIGESGKRKPAIAPINHLINEALSCQYQSLVWVEWGIDTSLGATTSL